jgi:hypothetical protein
MGRQYTPPSPEERARIEAWESGAQGRAADYRIPPDLMPRRVEVVRSSVVLMVGVELWNEETKKVLDMEAERR